ncbi:hypothetical protein AOL_s00079g84 [Orbilia oligospora ATCC 24927]|uniref:Uncharacterized protein n=2 Tax=Orbilia oligospora TaxID=2813651 RepID=G1XCY1_ARTOA|nr:hypothetical protein AOL_s00079g84 [Orbilia oligospora ATCC 24927]EGX48863.1 hypothetical protein AOL_s00079g84 [Orbilia oligospora ATCC 24927]KAF3284667.1 hypothetical protein TWF970_010957 [Orbilia oligospora]
MYPSVSRTFKQFDSSSFAASSNIWDPPTAFSNLAPRVETSRSYRKFAKPVSRSEAFVRPSLPASGYIDSYGKDASSKRRKRGPSELNDNLADDNYIPSIKSAINGGTMPSAGLKAGLKRELIDDDEDSDGEGIMKDSYLSETQYRRTCGTSTHESDDRGGKRRLLNVVGSVVGSIWEFCTSQMQNSLAGIIPKIGWSTAAAEYYDTPFNAPPGLFDGDETICQSTVGFVKPTLPGVYVPPLTTTFKKPTLQSLIPPSPVREEDNFSARSPDFSYLDEDLSRSRTVGMESPMSASWILVKPESNSRASSPAPPKSPTAGASAASMRRHGSNSGSRPSTPIFSTPPANTLGRRTSYSRQVPSRKMRGVASRPAVFPSGTRSGYLSRSSSISSPNTPVIGMSQSQSQSSYPSSFNSSQPSFASFSRGSMASSVTSVGSSLPTSPDRAGASAAGQRARGVSVSGATPAKKRMEMDEEDEMAQMDFFSKQLRALIREGKEALGSKVEVYECDEQDWM